MERLGLRQRYSPPRIGGVAMPSKDIAEGIGTDGVVSPE
jgi:hypothetical protein